MTVDLSAVAELGDPARTSSVCLYRMLDDRPLDECWEPPEGDDFGSGPLSHLIAQGIVAIESLTDPGTWAKFVEKVREQDPARAATLGPRPSALVYAIHRSNGLLTPEKLFTFARSEMATAATMLAKLGIPLQICGIP